ncbi:MAG: hypothetical protein K6U89_14075 [Chloroflexi bacterium]|nr:hypothetical protein [Chloroflexota bacterium]
MFPLDADPCGQIVLFAAQVLPVEGSGSAASRVRLSNRSNIWTVARSGAPMTATTSVYTPRMTAAACS